MNKVTGNTLVSLVLLLSACGGGGGGGGGANSGSLTPPTNTYCVNSPVAGCRFNTTDGTQFITGWWKGTRTYAPTGGVIDAYATGTNLGGYQIYLGDAFNQGAIAGTVQIQGSEFTTVNGSGTDANSTGSGVGISSAQMDNATGGVVTKSIMSFNSSGYAYIVVNNGTTQSGSATFKFTYNTDGDLPLSNYAGTYSGTDLNGNTSLIISQSGTITYNHRMLVQNYNGIYGFSTVNCVDNFSANGASSISSISMTLQSANNCGNTDSISFYSYLLNGTRYMVALGVPNAPVLLH